MKSIGDLSMDSIDIVDYWCKLNTTGSCPLPRSLSNAVSIDGDIYLFGGCTNTGPSNDLYVLNNKTLNWRLIKTEKSPSKRFGVK